MNTTSTARGVEPRDRDDNDGYMTLHSLMSTMVLPSPLFTTDSSLLFDIYLAHLPANHRQVYNCRACRNFIEHAGGLVTIDDDLNTTPAIWAHEYMRSAPAYFKRAVEALDFAVREASVTGIFHSEDIILGYPERGDWRHMHAHNPQPSKGESRAEDFKAIVSYIHEVRLSTLQLVRKHLLSSPQGANYIAMIEWVITLKMEREKYMGNRRKVHNLLWRSLADTPTGWAHFSNTIIGALVEETDRSGIHFAMSKFHERMQPDLYKRMQAPPKAGAVDRAEKLFADMDLESALQRRFATLDDVAGAEFSGLLWRDRLSLFPSKPRVKKPGVFNDLRPDSRKTGNLPLYRSMPNYRALHMTWAKFRRTVLPTAQSIQIDMIHPSPGFPISALLTATDPDSRPILKWDRPDSRNQFSWYTYLNGSMPRDWNIASDTPSVAAVVATPDSWLSPAFGSNEPGTGAIFVISGAKDVKAIRGEKIGLGLFPNLLRDELREVRSVIEAYSESRTPTGADKASVCGYHLTKAALIPVHIWVRDSMGASLNIIIDRWE